MIIKTSQKIPKLKLVDRYHPALNREATAITAEVRPKKEVKELCREMEILCQAVNGAGLAAPQVGEGLRAIVVRYEPGGYIWAVNPSIVQADSKKIDSREGCLSLLNEDFINKRFTKVKVNYTDARTWETVYREAEGFEAVIWQHELDHLNGKLIDRGERWNEPKTITKP